MRRFLRKDNICYFLEGQIWVKQYDLAMCVNLESLQNFTRFQSLSEIFSAIHLSEGFIW